MVWSKTCIDRSIGLNKSPGYFLNFPVLLLLRPVKANSVWQIIITNNKPPIIVHVFIVKYWQSRVNFVLNLSFSWTNLISVFAQSSKRRWIVRGASPFCIFLFTGTRMTEELTEGWTAGTILHVIKILNSDRLQSHIWKQFLFIRGNACFYYKDEVAVLLCLLAP